MQNSSRLLANLVRFSTAKVKQGLFIFYKWIFGFLTPLGRCSECYKKHLSLFIYKRLIAKFEPAASESRPFLTATVKLGQFILYKWIYMFLTALGICSKSYKKHLSLFVYKRFIAKFEPAASVLAPFFDGQSKTRPVHFLNGYTCS